MKVYAILLAALLVLSTLSLALVSAEPGRDKMNKRFAQGMMDQERPAKFAKDVARGMNESEIEDSFKELSRGNEKDRLGFASVMNGHGWATSSGNGSLLSLMVLSQEFVSKNGSNSTVERTLGRLMLAGDQYRLVLKSSSNSSMDFDVFSMKGNMDSNTTLGTLSLDVDSKAGSLTIWDGELTLDGKDFDVTVATDSNPFKSKGNLEHGQKKGFFKRLMFWKA